MKIPSLSGIMHSLRSPLGIGALAAAITFSATIGYMGPKYPIFQTTPSVTQTIQLAERMKEAQESYASIGMQLDGIESVIDSAAATQSAKDAKAASKPISASLPIAIPTATPTPTPASEASYARVSVVGGEPMATMPTGLWGTLPAIAQDTITTGVSGTPDGDHIMYQPNSRAPTPRSDSDPPIMAKIGYGSVLLGVTDSVKPPERLPETDGITKTEKKEHAKRSETRTGVPSVRSATSTTATLDDALYARLSNLDQKHPIGYTLNADGSTKDIFINIGSHGDGLSKLVAHISGTSGVTSSQIDDIITENAELVGSQPGNVWKNVYVRVNADIQRVFGSDIYNILPTLDLAEFLTSSDLQAANDPMIRYNLSKGILTTAPNYNGIADELPSVAEERSGVERIAQEQTSTKRSLVSDAVSDRTLSPQVRASQIRADPLEIQGIYEKIDAPLSFMYDAFRSFRDDEFFSFEKTSLEDSILSFDEVVQLRDLSEALVGRIETYHPIAIGFVDQYIGIFPDNTSELTHFNIALGRIDDIRILAQAGFEMYDAASSSSGDIALRDLNRALSMRAVLAEQYGHSSVIGFGLELP